MNEPRKNEPASAGVNPSDTKIVDLKSLPRRLRGSSIVTTPEREEENAMLDGGHVAQYRVNPTSRSLDSEKDGAIQPSNGEQAGHVNPPGDGQNVEEQMEWREFFSV